MGFVNGSTESPAGQNEGSCKVLAFGMLVGLDKDQLLRCFGEHYRSVLADPDGSAHGNIRAFMVSAWDGVRFPDGLPLKPLQPALEPFLTRVRGSGDIQFADTLAEIESHFVYGEKPFSCGDVSSESGKNAGSCKVFSFGKLHNLSKEETLRCFGEHYREVLGNPDGSSHGNIRAFMKAGWDGVKFPSGLCLQIPGVAAFSQRLSGLVFSKTLEMVAEHFDYSPKPFRNGGTESAAGSNEGSCKVFSFGKLVDLDEQARCSASESITGRCSAIQAERRMAIFGRS